MSPVETHSSCRDGTNGILASILDGLPALFTLHVLLFFCISSSANQPRTCRLPDTEHLPANLCRPVVFGEVPMTRFRHTGVVVKPEPSSIIEQLVNQRLHPGQCDASQGSVILLFGGYNTMGQEFGGDQFEVQPRW